MSRTIRTIALPAVAAILLAACGSSETTEDPAAADAPASEEAVNPSDGDAPMDDGEDDGEGYGIVEAGEWGHYSTIGMELPKGEGEIDVRVADYECGVMSIPDAEAEPEDGKEFCIFSIEYKNVGTTPYEVDEPGGVMLEDGSLHAQSDDDQDISWAIQDYVIDLNPGDTGEYQHVVSVPTNSTPASLVYPAETAVTAPVMALSLQ